MEHELTSNIKSALTTKILNVCCLYIGINFLSELCNANRMEIKPDLQDCDTLVTS